MLTNPRNIQIIRVTRRSLAFTLALLIMLALAPIQAGADETGVVTASELFIRAEPSTESDKLRTLQEGWKVTILGSEGDWYRIQYGEVVGYSASKYISKSSSGNSSSGSSSSSSSSSSSGKTTIASLGSAPSACKPGDKNNSVLKIQQALTILGYYSGNQTGNYGDLTEQAVRDFQKAKGLSVDGVAGKGTIKVMFGADPGKSTSSSSSSSSSSSGTTERLDWFNGGKSAIPKDAVFQIKDVRSGRTFKARRWSGGNHLDAEPYTSSDTATLKKCYGGKFSWARRPVLVKYNGHIYAGSMNGMPHGSDDTISNNDFDGVFCIHFYQSKTHGSDKVDDDHQACVSEAMKASW